jgi:rhodanese-related sulfurtransferase
MTQKLHIRELSPAEVQAGLNSKTLTLIDVREPAEFAAEHIHGAILAPLSSFDPTTLPMDPARPVVLHCGIGKRSAMAVQRCIAAGVPVTMHMKGGLAAWKAAGHRTAHIDAATGAVIDRR